LIKFKKKDTIILIPIQIILCLAQENKGCSTIFSTFKRKSSTHPFMDLVHGRNINEFYYLKKLKPSIVGFKKYLTNLVVQKDTIHLYLFRDVIL
jgi:hypothetical protein